MRTLLTDAGFADVNIDVKSQSKDIISAWMPGSSAEDFIASAYVTATKPLTAGGGATEAPGEDLFAQAPAPVQIAPGGSDKAGC